MGRNAIETILGAVVLVVAGLFMVFAYSSADLQKVQGYTINAYFPMVDGVKDGTDVKINGVKIGSVSGLRLITTPGVNQFKVDMKMTILPNILIPIDTIAMIASESLLGGKHVSLEVGVDEETVKTDGTGRITRTQSPMRLDDLIGQLIYNSKKSDNAAPPAAPQAVAPSPVTPSAPVAVPSKSGSRSSNRVPQQPSAPAPAATGYLPASPESLPAQPPVPSGAGEPVHP